MTRQKKLEDKVTIIHSNFFDVNLENAENVFVFLSNATSIMKKLKEKLFREMKPGGQVVSYMHRFSDWPPDRVDGSISSLYDSGMQQRKLEKTVPEGYETSLSV